MRLPRPNLSRATADAERVANYAEAALVVAAACSAVAWCITLLS